MAEGRIHWWFFHESNFFSGVRSRRLDISFILAVSCDDKQLHARCCSILLGVKVQLLHFSALWLHYRNYRRRWNYFPFSSLTLQI